MPRPSVPLVSLLSALTCLAATALTSHAAPPAGQAWKVVPLFSDEFDDGFLDTAKWRKGNPKWEGGEPGVFKDENVTFSEGKLNITIKAEESTYSNGKPAEFTTGSVCSRARIRYGYFECRLQATSSAASSAFWLFCNEPEQWTEIDICELSGTGKDFSKKIFMNAHRFHSPLSKQKHEIPGAHDVTQDLTQGYHTYGMHWSHKSLAWYFNGKKIREVPNTDWFQALHVVVDSNSLTSWFGKPKAADLPSTLSVDYVRVWQTTGK